MFPKKFSSKNGKVSPPVSETRPPEVYNTGDLASEDELGRIHYHGRIDWQVEFLQGDGRRFMDVLY